MSAVAKVVEGELVQGGPLMPRIRRLEAAIPLVLPEVDIDECTFHHHCKGVYVRQMTVPAGTVLVGKIHKDENFFLLVEGSMTIAGDDGSVITVEAPFMIVTKPGTKRVGFAHTRCIVLNIHPNPTNEREPDKLEATYIVPEDKPTLPAAVEKLLLERRVP